MSKSKKNVVDPLGSSRTNGAHNTPLVVLVRFAPERDVEWTAIGAVGPPISTVNRSWNISTACGMTKGGWHGRTRLLRANAIKPFTTVTMGVEFPLL